MIKFFRKIRKNLLAENKMGKYFKYAFGEIILVMIGILLALQVSNWNANREAQTRMDSRLVNLVQDLEADIIEMQDIMVIAENRAIITKAILQGAGRNGTFSSAERNFPDFEVGEFRTEDFPNPNSYLSHLETLDGHRSTYEALVNSGEFHLITDQNLAKEIQEYYAEVVEHQDAERWNNMESYVQIYQSKVRLGLGSYSDDGTLEKLIELASSDQQLGAELEHSYFLDIVQYIGTETLIAKAQKLIEQIESNI